MRSYIFTERERRLLQRYLKGERGTEIRKVLHNIRRSRPILLMDVKLLLRILKVCGR